MYGTTIQDEIKIDIVLLVIFCATITIYCNQPPDNKKKKKKKQSIGLFS